MTRSDGGAPPAAAGLPRTSESEELEQILARLPWGVLTVDRDLRVAFANAAATTLVASEPPLAAGEALPERWGDLQVRPYVAELFELDVPPEPRLALFPRRTLSVHGVAARGMDTAIVAVADVSDRERRQRADRHFLENAAHELRTPVAAIVSVVEALDRAKEEPVVRDRFLAHLRVHSDRLVRLSTSLLALARVQSGAETPQLELVRLRPFVEDLAEGLQHSAAVSLTIDVPAEVAALADPQLLRLIVTNIAQNAVKHTHEGEIHFAARRVDGLTELTVGDTGRGMTADDQDAAFDRFHRGGDGASEGFGLGLAIARDATEELGGTLDLESAPGQGTVVRIRLRSAEVVA